MRGIEPRLPGKHWATELHPQNKILVKKQVLKLKTGFQSCHFCRLVWKLPNFWDLWNGRICPHWKPVPKGSLFGKVQSAPHTPKHMRSLLFPPCPPVAHSKASWAEEGLNLSWLALRKDGDECDTGSLRALVLGQTTSLFNTILLPTTLGRCEKRKAARLPALTPSTLRGRET
jgi:hypothetical protein